MKCVEEISNLNGVKITQFKGKININNSYYNNLASIINPEILFSLTKLPEIQAGNKFIKRSFLKSAQFLKENLDELKDININILCAIQRGLEIDSKMMAVEMKQQRFAVEYLISL
ncbi:unnamed protein product [Paramecium sonneborni]|uniref:Uncharacterized protein n=1 Tax=Paramecium sonneborni TaxID=65129 RepID=A0A8S1LIX6_9CILI|nr:unnamed protein product [Paramecium sonneborni]